MNKKLKFPDCNHFDHLEIHYWDQNCAWCKIIGKKWMRGIRYE